MRGLMQDRSARVVIAGHALVYFAPGGDPRPRRIVGQVQGGLRPGLGRLREETFARQRSWA
jgi:hypothetical protein